MKPLAVCFGLLLNAALFNGISLWVLFNGGHGPVIDVFLFYQAIAWLLIGAAVVVALKHRAIG